VYGLIGKIMAQPGQRDALITILLENAAEMPGCFSYIVSQDRSDSDAVWVTEIWDSSSNHKASLSLPSVQHAIARAKPLITRFAERFETIPIGGHGIQKGGK
jgi:quinol monooxygenase YgiN